MRTSRILNLGISYSSFLFSFLIFFSIKLANVSLIVFYVFCLYNYLAFKPKIPKSKLKFLALSSILLLFSLIMSIVSFTEFDLIIKAFGRRITFLLTPLAFLLLTKDNIEIVKKNALKGLVLGGLFSSIYLIINILYEYYLTRPFLSLDIDLFNYYHTNFYFTRILDIHPSYYGMFLLLGIAVVYFSDVIKSCAVRLLFFIFSTTAILFLNARIILFLFFIINIFYIIRFFYEKTKSIKNTFLIAFSLFLLAGVLLYGLTKNTYAYQRVFMETLWEFSYEVGTNYSYNGVGDSRMARWIAAENIISKKPYLGYGVFNETKELVKEYKSLNMHSSVKNEYNAHNQFIGFAIEGGIISALTLIIFIFGNFVISIKKRDFLFFFFILSVFLICLVENYLIRNAGIIFTSFFTSLFLFYYKDYTN